MFKVIGGIIWGIGVVLSLYFLTHCANSIFLNLLLITFVITFFVGLIFWTIGVIFEEMKSIRQLIDDMKKEVNIYLTKGSNKTSFRPEDSHISPINSSVWICTSCDTINAKTSITCKGCGRYK